jgi:cell pole-organizing protein PopZ
MLEAKRLADEAAEAARAATEQAQRHAQELAGDAQQQAREAEAHVSRAEQLRVRSEATAQQTAAEGGQANGDLQDYTEVGSGRDRVDDRRRGPDQDDEGRTRRAVSRKGSGSKRRSWRGSCG